MNGVAVVSLGDEATASWAAFRMIPSGQLCANWIGRALAERIGVPTQRIDEIVRGKRGITPETAWLFAQAFDTTPEFWLNLQIQHDLAISRPNRQVEPFRMAA